jgi:hypothetical protein
MNEIESCLGYDSVKDEDLILVFSIDKHTPPKGMGVNGYTKVTGILYSRNSNSFIWKDTVEGYYDAVNTATFGLGGYTGKMILRSMGPDLTFRSNVFGSIKELLGSLPSCPKSR